MRAFNESFGIKVFVKFGIFITVIFFCLTAFFIYQQAESIRDNLLKKGNLLAAILAENSRIGLYSENKELLQDPMKVIFHQEGVLGVSVFNPDGRLLREQKGPDTGSLKNTLKGPEQNPLRIFEKRKGSLDPFYIDRNDTLEFWAPVVPGAGYSRAEALFFNNDQLPRKDRTIGFVKITVTKALMNRLLHDLLFKSLAIGLIFLIIGAVVTYFVVKGVTKPLNRLTGAVKTLGEGDDIAKVSVETADEIGKLAGAFNIMSESLKARGESLRQSEERFRVLAESATDAIYIADINKKIIYWNTAATKVFGYGAAEVLGKSTRMLKASGGQNFENASSNEFLETGISAVVGKTVKAQAVRKSGEKFPVEISVSSWQMNGQTYFGTILRDVTALRQAEKQIHALTQQLIMAQETERQRISLDLHDHVAQDLSTLRIACDTLFDGQPEVAPATRQRASDLSKMLRKSIKAVRNLSYDLRPAGLDQLGLERTVSEFCREFSEKNKIIVDFFSAGMDDLKPEFETEINLYRIIQEALNNVRKHADTGNVNIKMVASFPDIILRIEDSGKGFDSENQTGPALNGKRMGLRCMRERVDLLSGSMRIQSRPMEGTKIAIKVPYTGKRPWQEKKA